MRKQITILILCLLCTMTAMAHEYRNESALSNGHFVKIQVTETGIYRLTYDQLRNMGLQPEQVRLFGYGGNLINQNFTLPHPDDLPQIPFYMHTGADGVFSSGDYILFYAQGPVGWEWSGSRFAHTRNCYADYGCYFLSDDTGENLNMDSDTIIDAATEHIDVYSYTDLQLHELDQRNLIDLKGDEGGGREWYGEELTNKKASITIPFYYSYPVDTLPLVCRVDVAATSSEATTITATIAEQSRSTYIMGIPVSDFYTRANTGIITMASVMASQPDLSVKVSYSNSNASAVAYLNYIEMQVPCQLILEDNYLFIRNTDNLYASEPSCFHLSGADAGTQVWNITDPLHIRLTPTWLEGDTLCWMGINTSVQTYVAVQTTALSDWKSPSSRGVVAPQNLHKDLRGIHHVIVAPEEFVYAAQDLAQAHEKADPKHKWMVVSTDEVFNEYSSGTPDASAIRWMMKSMYDQFKGTDQQPQTLLLFGDGTFDNRHLLSTSPITRVLTYQALNSTEETMAYATDDYFGFMDDNDGISGSSWKDERGTMEIGVGRLPINSQDEAEGVVNKLITYLENKNGGNWRQQTCWLADDDDHGLHTRVSEAAAEVVRLNNPDFIVNKIYLDSYVQESSASGESYPIAYNQFTNQLQKGVLFMDYSGHGSANNICSEMFLTIKDVQQMTNVNQGVWALATCNFAHFDQIHASSAEEAVMNPHGGAIAVFSADRTVYASENKLINQNFAQYLFTHNSDGQYTLTLGDVTRLAKNATGYSRNKMAFVLLGDPSLRISYPTDYKVVASELPETIHAMDLITLRGYITTTNGDSTDTIRMNGKMTITLYDKMQELTTRDNDEPDPSKKQFVKFNSYPNKLYVGDAKVENGVFSCTFRVPKDIHYNYGAGRLVLYAQGMVDETQAEAIGYNENFMVGGSSPVKVEDQQGPDIQLYLNTPLFKDGDVTGSNPHFFANLSDENGINAVGSGIGHDLLLTLDNNNKQTYILNDYYTAKDTFTTGTVDYILPTLTDGSHFLSFRAWDMLNNASTATLRFTVHSGLAPQVYSLAVYPNPVAQGGTVRFCLMNDRPDDQVYVDITFYNLSGQKLKSVSGELNDSYLDVDMSSVGLPTGIYIYQFTIRTLFQVSSQHSGKLMVY